MAARKVRSAGCPGCPKKVVRGRNEGGTRLAHYPVIRPLRDRREDIDIDGKVRARGQRFRQLEGGRPAFFQEEACGIHQIATQDFQSVGVGRLHDAAFASGPAE